MERYQPMLAEKAPEPFDSPQHFYEPKWDGSRCLAYVEDGRVRLVGRSGADYTDTFPELQGLRVHAAEAVLDGEVVVLVGERTDFRALQSRVHRSRGLAVRVAARTTPVTYMIFDVLRVNGVDLTALGQRVPLEARKPLLSRLVEPDERCRLAQAVEGDGIAFFQECIGKGLEGMMAKDRRGLYYPGKRHPAWLKVKGVKEDSFLVGGLTCGEGWRQTYFGALLLGRPGQGGLRYCGSVGSGFAEADLAQVLYLTHELHTDRCPFILPPNEPRLLTYLEPRLVVDVHFHEETPDGKLRFPVFMRVRDDLG